MRKHIMLATLIGLCALSVTACQRGENKPAAPAPGATAEQTTPANPGSDSLNTASNQQDPAAQNGQENMPNQVADNSASAPAAAAPSDNSQIAPTGSSTDTGTGTPASPSDSDSPAMQGNAPSSSMPAGQAPSTGGTDNNAPAGDSSTPSSGGDNSSTMTPSEPSK